MREDTIAAIATPIGEGGIGIIRISGEEALNILKGIFVPAGNLSGEIKNKSLTYGHIREPNSGKILDEVMAVYMKGPKTYTTEDVVEIQCHGSVVSLTNILNLVLSMGARLAERGEFTKRAFLGGRLDLSQAEAVIDLIKAKTDRTFDVAMDQLEGRFSCYVGELRAQLTDVLVNLTVNIDYPDEDIEEMTYEKLLNSVERIKAGIQELLTTSETGRIIRDGLRISIVGKPNVGKSSLMNSLMGQSRAIVTDIPGTTRDTIEESLNLRGLPVVLTDTAGIHETRDPIERIGIERSKAAFNDADLIILVLDGSKPISKEDLEIINKIGERNAIVMLNKRDKGIVVCAEEILNLLPKAIIIESVLTESKGIEALAEAIESMVYDGQVSQNDNMMVTNIRHKKLLEKGLDALIDAESAAEDGEPFELIEIDVNRCYEFLGEIIGETASADIIDKVFERFCLGK